MNQDSIYGCIGISILALLLMGMEPFINRTNVVNAQITIGDNGHIAIKTEVLHSQRALNIDCSPATDCGTPTYKYGLGARGAGAYSSYGVYGIAEDAYDGIGVWGSANNNYAIGYGVRGSASNSPTSYGGYFTSGIYVNGGVHNGSDERLKTNIRPLRDENMLSRIRQLNPARYEYLSSDQLRQRGMPASHAEEGEHLGLLAQELEIVFPELVRDVVHILDDDPSVERQGEPETATAKAINYNGLIVALIAAVQEQQEEIEELKHRFDQSGM